MQTGGETGRKEPTATVKPELPQLSGISVNRSAYRKKTEEEDGMMMNKKEWLRNQSLFLLFLQTGCMRFSFPDGVHLLFGNEFSGLHHKYLVIACFSDSYFPLHVTMLFTVGHTVIMLVIRRKPANLFL